MAGVSSSMAKPQFGPWLIEQVQGRQYEGLYMTGTDTFRIPWKHNSRKDCGNEDNKIFREWAVVSGKICEYPNDKAKWKTNFRCALHSLKQFEMVHDNSKDSEDPHKIYRIIRPDNLQESQNIHIQDEYNTADMSGIMEHEDLLTHMDTLHLNAHSEIQPWPAYPQPTGDAGNYFANPLMGVILQPGMHNNIPAPVPFLAQQHYTTVPHNPIENLPSPYELEISIHYRKAEMLKVRRSAPVVQLHYHCHLSELRGESIPFPSTESLIDHKQVQYTKRILDNIQRGLLLEVTPMGIYGFRQDKCNVFVSTSDPAEIQNPEPKKLLQNCRELLFSFDKYTKDLRDFRENCRGSPEYTIYLCFGEKFPDGKPLEKKLIVVKVVPLICRELHKRAQMDGASSLHNDNISLQISNSLFDLIDSTFLPPTAD
ncbi:interferon regulatory factor 7 isoform X1 [Colossoma macropomum]|uniref:interferon regulatory factor 7 isoform X1 n=1 Tax=Colossoma macropomum TaxID=42526 RepID=UPI001863B398|nr:interferon regulatory factor 7 isoform X1 [Colossoma macropomum]